MDKGLLLKGLKIGALVLFAVGFLLPFITGTLMGIVNYSYSAFELEELNPDKSADIFVIIFYVLAIAGIVVMFLKPEFERIAYVAALAIGFILLLVIYVQVFNDSDLKLAVDMNIMTAKIGFGIIFQLIMVVVGVVLEFFGKKLLKVE
jgi:cytochrome c oxidase subunit IV